MLHKYRKTATIEAEQFDGSEEMVGKYFILDKKAMVSVPIPGTRYDLLTKEGAMGLEEGDWIATGIDGEHWVIANDIFQRTYERCD